MHTQTVTNPFLVSVTNKTSLWETPDYPDLEDPEWAQLFDAGTDMQKNNLARSWIWLYAQLRNNDEVQIPHYKKEEFFEKNNQWIRKVQPYLSADYFTQARLGKQCADLAKLFGKEPDSPSVTNELWFGKDERKLTLITESAENRLIAQELLCDERNYNRLWEVLKSSMATGLHHEIVAWNAIETGLRKWPSGTLDCKEHLQWHSLGYFAQYNTSLGLTDDDEKVTQLKGWVQEHEPELAINLMTKLFDFMLQEECPGCFFTSSAGLPFAEELSMDNVYEVLGTWLPSFKGQWLAAKGLGLDLTEARDLVLTSIHVNEPYVQVPDDLVLNSHANI